MEEFNDLPIDERRKIIYYSNLFDINVLEAERRKLKEAYERERRRINNRIKIIEKHTKEVEKELTPKN